MVLWLISGIILLIGIILCLYFIFGYKKKFSGVTHYEELRDKLTIRKKKEPNATLNFGDFIPNGGIGSIIGAFVVVLVGINLIPIVADVVNQNAVNVSGAANSILDLTTTFFALSILLTGVSLAVGGLKESGLV